MRRITHYRQHLSALACLAFVAGVGYLQLSPQLPVLPPLLFAAAATAAAAWRFSRLRRWLIIVLMILAGIIYANIRAEQRLATSLPPDYIWQDITVEGVISGFPDVNNKRSRFDMQIDTILSPQTLTVNLKARLTDYHRDSTPATVIAAGKRLRLQLRLRQPDSSVNPHGFDYAGYLFAHNIRLVGYVRNRQDIIDLSDDSSNLRQRLYARIHNSQADSAALIAALVIGDRSKISDGDWQVLRRTGTAHLISVSGVHIGFIFFIAVSIFGSLYRRSQRLTALLPTMPAAVLLALPAAFGYALLAGFSVPIQRSFFMASTAAIALFLGGVSSVFSALALAMLVVILLDPWALLAPGFWLSFVLTAAVLAAVKSSNKQHPAWLQMINVQLLLSVAAVPLTLWFFNEASLISPLANIVAIPVVGFAALPLALGGVFAGDWCWLIAGWILNILWQYLQWLSHLPYAAYTPAAPPLWLFITALAGAAWLLAPRALPWRISGMLPISAMLLWTPPPPANGAFVMTVLDVGQGSAAVIQTRRHVVVYDTGRYFGGRTIADYLHGQGIKKIDKLIISHDDYDHRGGAEVLLESIPADSVIASDGDMQCNSNLQWHYDDVRFTVLHPPADSFATYSSNDSSCVVLVENQHTKRALLTGDISAAIESRLTVRADVLLAPHHGSRHSSSSHFLHTVRPEATIISVGRNKYGHPHTQTLKRLQKADSKIYRTDKDGAVIVSLDDTIDFTRWRSVKKNYWH